MEKDEGEDKSITLRLDLTDSISISPRVGQKILLEIGWMKPIIIFLE
jgi:hypothetical protein